MAPKQVAKSKAAPNLDSILKNGLMTGGGQGRRIMNFFGVFPPCDERNRDAGSFLPYSIVLSAFGYATILGHDCHHNAIHPQCATGVRIHWRLTVLGKCTVPNFSHFRFFCGVDENGSFEDMAQLFSNFWVAVLFWYDPTRPSSSFTPMFFAVLGNDAVDGSEIRLTCWVW